MEDSEITKWEDFQELTAKYAPPKVEPREWIFRGIYKHKTLRSTLERACDSAGLKLDDAPGIERQLIREFRRVYDGADSQKVQNDTLYCMGLMQHYGAPTRLLDWTYSPYVALFFAIKGSEPSECGQHVGYLWVLDSAVCRTIAHEEAPDKTVEIERRFSDEGVKEDASFCALYFYGTHCRFVLPENPWSFHERHKVQQGVFLCPGDVSVPYDENLRPIRNRDERCDQDTAALHQHRICMSADERARVLDQLRRANVGETSLFPGLDGFARSFWQRMPFFQRQHDRFKRQYKMTE